MLQKEKKWKGRNLRSTLIGKSKPRELDYRLHAFDMWFERNSYCEGGDSQCANNVLSQDYRDAKSVLSFCSSSKTAAALPPLRSRLQVKTCFRKHFVDV
ncbi:hypothetical protein DVH24_003889 [Malus domestica]|uniref:Uncharacterized protein n=1 Tax=Malus domestica TaxID=3750 RepID=A0A498K7B7_MALDO|nr:hypothetical protein DVH24_003889 [Malus domestica]